MGNGQSAQRLRIPKDTEIVLKSHSHVNVCQLFQKKTSVTFARFSKVPRRSGLGT